MGGGDPALKLAALDESVPVLAWLAPALAGSRIPGCGRLLSARHATPDAMPEPIVPLRPPHHDTALIFELGRGKGESG